MHGVKCVEKTHKLDRKSQVRAVISSGVIPTKPRQFKHALRHKADPILSMVYKRLELLK